MFILISLLCYINSIHGSVTWYRTSTGTINAYGWRNVSGGMWQHTYKIELDRSIRFSKYIKLTWRRFSVDGGRMPYCRDDSVVVFTGCSEESKVAKFCTKNMKSMPHDIYSKDGCMRIVLTKFSSSSPQSLGFDARYTSSYLSSSAMIETPCSIWTSYNTRSGVVASPSWPSQYSTRECKRTYKTGDSGLRYVINIMDMNMDTNGRSSCSSYSGDYVYIKGEKTVSAKGEKYWRFCTPVRGMIINTAYYELSIKMKIRYKSRRSTQYRGFVIGYVAYEDDVARALTSWGAIIGGVIVAIIGITFVFCCYRRWRRRQAHHEHRPLNQTNVHIAPATVHPPPDSGAPAYSIPPPNPSAYPVAPYNPSAPAYPPAYTDKPPQYEPPPYAPPSGAPPGAPPPGAIPAPYPTAYPPPQGYGYPPSTNPTTNVPYQAAQYQAAPYPPPN